MTADNRIKILPPRDKDFKRYKKGKKISMLPSASPSALFKTVMSRYSFKRFSINPVIFLVLTVLLTFSLTYTCSLFIVWEEGNLLYPSIWISGFTVLVFDLVLHVLCAILYPITKSYILKETDLESIPACAIVYPVRNESVGLYERILYTLENNNLPNVTLCFLSDSSPEYFEYESSTVSRLRKKFGEKRIYYWHRPIPYDAKPGNIKGWFKHHHQEYKYFFVCDADSMLPRGALLKLLRKAEHPENSDVGIFQTHIEVAHAKTLFSKHQALGVHISQRLYTDVKQRIFGTALSFGHGNLIRTSAFLLINVPPGVLSHDIWDMTLLNQKGYKTIFCPDVISYEEVPSNYLEMRRRDRRWIKGNFQSAPLLFKRGLSLGTRFYLFYGVFMYTSQPIFLSWIIFSVFGNSTVFGQFLFFKPIMGSGMNPLFIEVYYFTIFIIGLVFLHKFLFCKTPKDIMYVIKEIMLSTIISLNNIVYHTIDIIFIAFKKIRWVPMKKDPYGTLTLNKTVRHMWPGTFIGIWLTYFVFNYCPSVTILIFPILISFVSSIPIIYITSFPFSR